MFDFLSEISLIGWLGVLLWFIVPVLTIWGKREWFFDFDERFPQFNFLTELVSEWGFEGLFMVVRYIVLIIITVVLGTIWALITMPQ